MKCAPIPNERRSRRRPIRALVGATMTRQGHGIWNVPVDPEGGLEADLHEVVERISRGTRIRGHAL